MRKIKHGKMSGGCSDSCCLKLEGVSVHIQGEDILEDVSFHLHCGEITALIGPNGAGKSTLFRSVLGQLSYQGNITFSPAGGPAIRLADGTVMGGTRPLIGYVPQSPYILQGTVAANVAFSQWGKPYDAEKVARACRMAALDLVEKDPRGIEYPIGERGSGLSGGQAQRVSIARALYAAPDILILDESTSALDLGTESAIMDTIAALKGQLTIIIIAHRLSTVEHCDRLIWMENGRIHRIGTPQELLPEYMKSFGV